MTPSVRDAAMRQADTAANGIAFDRATVAALLGDLELGRGNFDAAHTEYEKALRLAARARARRDR